MAEELNNEKLQMPLLIIDSGVLTKSFQKPVSIGIVFKNVSSLNTPAYLPVRCTQTGDMMQGTRRVYSGLTWHATSLAQTNEKRNA
jgi:hypothetical protein